jgi:protein gp37
MHPDWARSLRDQCAAADVPFLFKQWGDWAPTGAVGMGIGGPRQAYVPDDTVTCHHGCGAELVRVGKKAAGRVLDRVTHDGYPEEATHG